MRLWQSRRTAPYPVCLGAALLAAFSMSAPVLAGGGDNPALRVIEERIGEFLTLFSGCRAEGIATITECFGERIGPDATAAAIGCFGADRVPRSATQEQRSCLLDVSFVHDIEHTTGFFGGSQD